ncbi:MAG: PepSY-associated TM helix domain-containing protein, partial [Alcanivorax sp.]|uniref:PepSY-associated TM helix domain-containing protein n=1 Tax=Alcanivorax sp. TaxID=1872427 RepID=UPI003DA6DF13
STLLKQLGILHRDVGLVVAGLLVIAGLTGALLVWYHELDARFNPQLLRVSPPSHNNPPLSPFALRDKVEAAFPSASVNWMLLQRPSADRTARFFIAPKDDASTLSMDEVFVDPYSGDVLGGRRWGDISQGITNVMPFIYRLHYSLALGTIGTWVFGVISLLWMVDCFVGAYLTFPPRRRRASTSSLNNVWKRWRPAWKIRWRSRPHKRDFDLHRAGGLWPWALLFVFAWSSVAMNLYAEIYRPATGLFMTFQDNPLDDIPAQASPAPQPQIGWQAGFVAARQHLEKQAAEKGFQVLALERFAYYPEKNALKLMVSTDRDVNQRFGESWLYIDATRGHLLGFYLPTGEAAGDTLTTWLTTLHIAGLGGLPYRILVTMMGVAVVSLSLTGIIIWWRKRAARTGKR